MAQNVILAEQEVSGFVEMTTGIYGAILELFSFVTGETYTVVFDGNEYFVTAFDMSDGENTYTVIGNPSIFNMGDNTNEPFVMFPASTDGSGELDATVIATNDTTTDTHTVAIYQVAEEVGIITRDRNFNETEHYGMETVTFDTTDGGTQVFSKGQAVEGVEIALDFSGGDQTVKAPTGTLVKSAVIEKPVDLVAEKIVKGASIAGIDGTFETVLETLEVTENGTFTPSEGVDGFSSVTVDVKSANICYIGTSTPDSTIGNDGDLYIVKE